MRRTQAAFDRLDLEAMGIDPQRLGFRQRQRVMAFLADSAHYLGLTAAGSAQRQDSRCVGVGLAPEDAQLTAGVRGC